VVFMMFWLLLALSPLATVVLGSLTDSADLAREGVNVPSSLTLDNYRRAWHGPPLGQPVWHAAWNSSIAVAVGVLLALAAGVPAAYALSQRRAAARVFGLYFLGLLLLPGVLTWIPLFRLASDWKLVNSPASLGLVYAAAYLPLVVLIMRGQFQGFPRSLLEAAFLDGASARRAFLSVVLPLSMRRVAAVGLLLTVSLWHELAIASLLLQRGASRTVPVEVALFRGQFAVDIGAQYATLCLALVPLLPLLLFGPRGWGQAFGAHVGKSSRPRPSSGDLSAGGGPSRGALGR
jgi:ABC-type glycerol-3-phosphate transport system permease component